MSVAARPGSGRRATAPPRRVPPARRLTNFLRTPKGTVLLLLLGLMAVAAFGVRGLAPAGVAAAVGGATGVDLALTRWRQGRWLFPSGGLLTGLFVALVLSRQIPPYVPLATAAFAIGVKHAVRTRWSNIFNPAALGLIASALVFHSGQSWWITLPKDGVLGFGLVLAAGWYIAARLNKLPLVLAFLLTFLPACTAAAFLGDAAPVAQVFRAPDINALVFFACFMLTDPPTSPARHADQTRFGAVAGMIAAAVFLLFGVQWFILAGLPVANAGESVRRVLARRRAASRAGATGRGPSGALAAGSRRGG